MGAHRTGTTPSGERDRLKSLFVTHTVGTYGASTSLQTLLRNYRGASYDLVLPKRLLGSQSLEGIGEWFGGGAESVWEFYLPFDSCHRFRPEKTMFHRFLEVPRIRILSRFHQHRLFSLIARGRYDFIHLNSLVLHEIISPAEIFILHVREIFDGSNPRVYDSLRKARGVIFIDNATREPFSHLDLPNSIVLNNPFDMTGAAALSRREIEEEHPELKDCTVFSLIGRVTEKKGAEFVIRCFMEVPNADNRLLIVGEGDPQYIKKCRDIARKDLRIVLWGEESDIRKIYLLTDYVLRGEPFQCVGRTIFEGLYAGCSVIQPAVQDGGDFLDEYDTFRDSTFLYPPRDAKRLKELFRTLAGKKIRERTFRSNVERYTSAFQDFIGKILDSQTTAGKG
jgi:glycosyltransferase involved in cell wall biosynthesis